MFRRALQRLLKQRRNPSRLPRPNASRASAAHKRRARLLRGSPRKEMATGTRERFAAPAPAGRRSERRSGRIVPTSFARRLTVLPRQALTDDQKLRGGRGGAHRRILGFETRHSNRADESSEL